MATAQAGDLPVNSAQRQVRPLVSARASGQGAQEAPGIEAVRLAGRCRAHRGGDPSLNPAPGTIGSATIDNATVALACREPVGDVNR